MKKIFSKKSWQYYPMGIQFGKIPLLSIALVFFCFGCGDKKDNKHLPGTGIVEKDSITIIISEDPEIAIDDSNQGDQSGNQDWYNN